MAVSKKKRKSFLHKSTWVDFGKKMRVVLPYLWPDSLRLKLQVILCVLCIIAARLIAVLIPIYYKKIVDSFTRQYGGPVTASLGLVTVGLEDVTAGSDSSTVIAVTGSAAVKPHFIWQDIVIYSVIKALHGGTGYINIARSMLWVGVAQEAKRKLHSELFSHVHGLSARWHITAKPGEVVRIMDRGVNSVNMIITEVFFQIFPIIADVTIAVVFFLSAFDVYIGLTILLTMGVYLGVTFTLNEWRTKYRRLLNERDNERTATSTDSISNYETVKHFAAEDFEVERYCVTVNAYLSAEWVVNATMNLLNFIQKTIMSCGMLAGSLLCAWYIYNGKFTVGDYVLFTSYVEQLYVPLLMFGAYYRMLQNSLVDMENMMDLRKEPVDVKDVPDASQLQVEKGVIEFDNISFEYKPGKPVLQNVSFTVPAGKTYALVSMICLWYGEHSHDILDTGPEGVYRYDMYWNIVLILFLEVGASGCGKSTVLRLLMRLYDLQPNCGHIRIDSQDIYSVTRKSLLARMGIVAQDIVLFNKDVTYNIRYGHQSATEEDIIAAATVANVHDTILAFPEGYASPVGQRGARLSGGERQRVGLARAAIKFPRIMLLDEATSALDASKEMEVRESIKQLSADSGMTVLIITHLLYTVRYAHCILVLHQGRIVERGSHEELMKLDGAYKTLWNTQQRSEQGMPGNLALTANGEPAALSIGPPARGPTECALTVAADVSHDSSNASTGKTSHDPAFESEQCPENESEQDPSLVDSVLVDSALVDSALVEDDTGLRMAAMLADVPMADDSDSESDSGGGDKEVLENKPLLDTWRHDSQRHSPGGRSDGSTNSRNRRSSDHVVDVDSPPTQPPI